MKKIIFTLFLLGTLLSQAQQKIVSLNTYKIDSMFTITDTRNINNRFVMYNNNKTEVYWLMKGYDSEYLYFKNNYEQVFKLKITRNDSIIHYLNNHPYLNVEPIRSLSSNLNQYHIFTQTENTAEILSICLGLLGGYVAYNDGLKQANVLMFSSVLSLVVSRAFKYTKNKFLRHCEYYDALDLKRLR